MKNAILFVAILASLCMYAGCKADQHEATPTVSTTTVPKGAVEGLDGNLDNVLVTDRAGCLVTDTTCPITITLVSGTFDITVCGIAINTGLTCAQSNSCNITAGPYRQTFTSSPAMFCSKPGRPIVVTNNNASSVNIVIDVNGNSTATITIAGNSSEAFTLPANCDAAADQCP